MSITAEVIALNLAIYNTEAAALVRSLERVRVAAEQVNASRYDHGAAGYLWVRLSNLEAALDAHRKEFGS
jgi:hypothetical protein